MHAFLNLSHCLEHFINKENGLMMLIGYWEWELFTVIIRRCLQAWDRCANTKNSQPPKIFYVWPVMTTDKIHYLCMPNKPQAPHFSDIWIPFWLIPWGILACFFGSFIDLLCGQNIFDLIQAMHLHEIKNHWLLKYIIKDLSILFMSHYINCTLPNYNTIL